MKNILFFAPSKKIAVLAETIITKRNLDVEVCLVDFKNVQDIAAQARRVGAKVIVSRGGLAAELRKVVDMPVIDVKFSSGCYIEAFEKVCNVKGKVAFFSVEEIQDNVRTLCYILDIDAEYYRFHNEQTAKDAVCRALSAGCVLGVGGAVTGKYAGENRLEYIVLENSAEDIENALDSAQQTLTSLMVEENKRKALQLQLQRYEAIFNYTHDGIIAIDKNGKVEVVNKQAEEILPLKNKPYEGKAIEDVLPSTKLTTVLRSGEMETDELMKVENSIINTNRIPIVIDGQVEGVVATFRDIESIQISEQKIRSNLHKRGMVSKYRFADIMGESKEIKKAIRIAKSYAKNNSNVLIFGEIGTGKEMFAHSIHRESARKTGPFVEVNCANISSATLLAELCGYEESANPFGTKGKRDGAFELAHGGTLFLDKIDEAPLDVQMALLRVIEDKEVRKMGCDHVIPVDVRVIASAAGDRFLTEVREGRFIEELYYLISVLTLEIPPLRERGDDYLLLCEDWFRRSFGAEYRKYEDKIKQIESYVSGYEWKGNIRQLSNFVERVSVLLKNDVSVEDVVCTLPHAVYPGKEREDLTLEKWTRAAIIKTLSDCRLNISKAARELNCSRSTLYKKMEEFNIKITNIK